MDQLEKVDKLRERANVSYEEAKEALEARWRENTRLKTDKNYR